MPAGSTDSGNNLLSQTDPFVNSTDPDGTDNIIGTADDGIQLKTGAKNAVDSGKNAAHSPSTDILGNTRIVNTTIDMGTYERP